MIDADVLFQQAAAALRHERRASYRLQLGSRARLRRGRGARPLPRGARRSATSTSRPASAAAPAAPTATTSPTTTRSTPSSAARPAFDRHGRRRSPRAGSACSSTWCPTTWASRATPTPGGSTCSRTARPRRAPSSSTSTGHPVKAGAARPVLLPILGDQYGRVLESQQLALELDGRRLPPAVRGRAPAARPRPTRRS